MSQAGLESEMGRIEDAMQVLQAKWDQTRETWRDGNAESVDENFMIPLRELVTGALPAIGHLSDVLKSSVRTVSDPRDRGEYL